MATYWGARRGSVADHRRAADRYVQLVASAADVRLWEARCASRSIWVTKGSSSACRL